MESRLPVFAGASSVRRHDVAIGMLTASRFPANLSLPRHHHPLPTVAVIVEGGFDGSYRTGERECWARSVVVEPAGESHENRFGRSETTILTLSLAADGVAREADAAANRLSSARDAFAGLVARRAVAELDRPDDVTPLALEAAAFELMARIARTSLRERQPTWLAAARDVLHDRFAESLTLGQIADELGVEPGRMARAFRRSMGEPMAGYLRRIRVDAGASLLATTDLPIARIAADVGFADQAHLTRWFAFYVGTTPGRFRAARRQAPRVGRP